MSQVPIVKSLQFEKVGKNIFATIQLPRSKIHKMTERTNLIIHSMNDDLCPVQALKTYIIRRTELSYASDHNVLFIKPDGSATIKRWFISNLKMLLSGTNIEGHSFCAGGTTELVLRGVQLSLIQKISRWSSEAFYRYIRTHLATVAAMLTEVYSN